MSKKDTIVQCVRCGQMYDLKDNDFCPNCAGAVWARGNYREEGNTSAVIGWSAIEQQIKRNAVLIYAIPIIEEINKIADHIEKCSLEPDKVYISAGRIKRACRSILEKYQDANDE